jgi:CheY-like chemotaxis protein
MSKIEANKLELSPVVFSPEKMLENIVGMIKPQMQTKRQQLDIEIGGDIPTKIKADSQRLSQVLMNLLSNAIKFTADSGAISLSAKLLSEQNGIITMQFCVTDSGIGMTDDQVSKLFQPFEQADGSISRKFGGTGLGLAISKQIIEMMGGSIVVESTPGKGSSFVFEICAEQAIPGEAEDGLETVGEGNHDFTEKKILIAEDIEINREIIATLLEPTGVSIDFAHNGRAAFEKFIDKPQDYDAIFMDIHMPEVDGYEASAMIRSQTSCPKAGTIPIIAMTADVFKEDIEKCINAGMNDHIGKPLDIDCVFGKLERYLK